MRMFTLILGGLVGLCLTLVAHWLFWAFVSWDANWLSVIPTWGGDGRLFFLMLYAIPFSIVGAMTGVGLVIKLWRAHEN